MEKGQLLAVGQPYTLFENNLKGLVGHDGGFLEAFEKGSGFCYTLLLNSPSKEEIERVSSGVIKMRLVDDAPFCLPLIQFGSNDMIFEMSFDPTLYGDKRALQMKDTNNLLTIVLVDSKTQRIAALRHANLPLRFIQRCGTLWEEAFQVPDYSELYMNWYANKQRISLQDLWNRAIYLGKLGEKFDLEKLK